MRGVYRQGRGQAGSADNLTIVESSNCMPLQKVPKWSKIFFLFVGLSLALASCAAREFDNPVDPNNPARNFSIKRQYRFLGGQPAGLVFHDEELWVTDPTDSSLTKLRASDGQSQYSLQLGYNAFGVTHDGSFLWLTVLGGAEVRRINPGDPNEPLSILPTPGHDPRGIAFHDELLWVVDGSDKTISKIDPKVGKPVGDPIPAGNLALPGGLTFRNDELWAVDQFGSRLVELDPDTGSELASYTLPVGKAIGVASDGERFYYSELSGRTIYIVELLESQTRARSVPWLGAQFEAAASGLGPLAPLRGPASLRAGGVRVARLP
jgi:DNA-binding beta-propeller fold protein YncE